MDHLTRAYPPMAKIDLAHEADFEIGALKVRPARCDVELGGIRRTLQRRVMQVLVALAHPTADVVSHDELIRRCWGGLTVGEDAIVRCVGQLRRLSEAWPQPPYEIETIPGVGYRLFAQATSPPPARLSLPPRSKGPWILPRLLLAALVLTASAGFAVLKWRDHVGSDRIANDSAILPKVTAAPFTILGQPDTDLHRFAGGLEEKIIGQLNASHLSVVDPAHADQAIYGVGGTVERDGGDIVVGLELKDLRQHVTLWSEELRNSAAEADLLQQDAGHLGAQVVNTAAHGAGSARGDPETVGLIVRADVFSLRNSDQTREEEWNNDRALLAKLPRSAQAHAYVAVVSAFLAANSASSTRTAGLKSMAAKEATAALNLDPKNALAYFTRYLIYPAAGRWSEREAALQAGLEAAPHSGLLLNQYSNFLREVGRSEEALEFGRQAAAQRPPSGNRDATLLLALATTGRDAEASALADKLGGDYAGQTAVWNSRFETMLMRGDWTAAAGMLAPGADRSGMGEAERRAWLAGLKALHDGSAVEKRKAIAGLTTLPAPGAVVAQPPHEIYNPGERIGLIALLGGLDQAYVMATSYLHMGAYADSSFLFWPGLSDFRTDPRFRALTAHTGLASYWAANGKRADVCNDAQTATC